MAVTRELEEWNKWPSARATFAPVTLGHIRGYGCGDLLTQLQGAYRNFIVERGDMYVAQHCAILSGDGSSRLYDLPEGESLMQLIAAVECSARWSQRVCA
jgi:hypothetical protein